MHTRPRVLIVTDVQHISRFNPLDPCRLLALVVAFS